MIITKAGAAAGASADPLLLTTEYSTTVPTTPTTGVTMFAAKRAGENFPAFVNTQGRFERIQTSLGMNAVILDTVSANAATTSAIGVAWTGTLTAAAWASTNHITSQTRGTMTISTAAGMVERRANNFICARMSSSSTRGSFHIYMTFALQDFNTGAKMFVGLSGTNAAFTNVQPSTLFNLIGLGKDGTDTAISLMINDGSGAVTKISLPNTGPPIASSYELNTFTLEIFMKGGATEFGYRVLKRDSTGTIVGVDEGLTGTTNVPADFVPLVPHYWLGNSSAVVLTLAYMRTYMEMD